ncbi:hypothetical protein B0H10DRAFT_1947183 [Mycena sp. CBHHK59/15]|nr:hypothetical protein B0H10DRAFT_1947183 [Mycena sp. CBHHK59/15]
MHKWNKMQQTGGLASPHAGVVHPRPPDDGFESSDADDGPLTFSCSTCRIIKRTRIYSPVELLEYAEPEADDEDPYEASEPPRATLPIPEPDTSDLVASHLAHLASLMDAALATITLIEDASLRSCIMPPTLPPSPAAHTYANVASTPPLQSDLRSAPPPLATQPTASRQQKSAPMSPSCKACHSPHHLILRWTNSPDKCAPVSHLAAELNEATHEHDTPQWILGTNWMTNEVMQKACGGFLGPAIMEVDVLWMPVVVHGIPAQPLVDALNFEQEEFWLAMEQTGNGPAKVKAVGLSRLIMGHPVCGATAPQTLSLTEPCRGIPTIMYKTKGK